MHRSIYGNAQCSLKIGEELQKLIPGQTEIKRHIALDIGSWFVRWKSIRRNSVPRVGYRGVIKSITDNKLGEFTLPLRTTKINIRQAIDRLLVRVSRYRRVHLSSYGGESCMSVQPKPRKAYRINRLCSRSALSTQTS
jgi:hypothetical protein